MDIGPIEEIIETPIAYPEPAEQEIPDAPVEEPAAVPAEPREPVPV